MTWLPVTALVIQSAWAIVLTARHIAYSRWQARLDLREHEVGKRERSLDDDLQRAFNTGRDVGR